MKIIKPMRLSVLQRPFRWQEDNYLGVSVLALADMGPKPLLRPEMELWQLMARELKTNSGVVDLGIPKSHAEFLATGIVYTHHQEIKTHCIARIDIEKLTKSVVISGDRHWVDSKMTPPKPFNEMHLDWCHAYGGEGFEDNPYGIGFGYEMVNKRLLQRIPNIEALMERIISPSQKAVPVSFGPLEFQWPRRFKRMGNKYNLDWLQNDFPGFARDIDWTVFNAASPDQWWCDRDSLPSQANWRIWNMHPKKPMQEGKLPPWSARCFINRQSKQSQCFEEIALRATTVWFFPHLEQMLLIWQGQTRINEDDAADVLQLLPALEKVGASRSHHHYRKVLAERMDKEKGALFSFREKDLVPLDAIGPWIDSEIKQTSSAMAGNLQNRAKILREQHRARLEQCGDDIHILLNNKDQIDLHALEDLPEFVEKIEREVQQMKADADQRQLDTEATHLRFQDAKNLPRGPESLHMMQEMLHHRSHSFNEKKLAQIRKALHLMYLSSAHYQPSALRLEGEIAQILRQRAERTFEQGGDFSCMDLTGVDFSGMDLRDANFAQALLECADFRGCQLDGANFQGAMLARTNLHHTSMRGCDLSGASLALAKCRFSDFSGAHFSETQLQNTLFDTCIFDNACLEGLLLRELNMIHCRFRQTTLNDCIFMKLTLTDPDFYGARLHKTSFMHSVLEAAIFSSATLVDCSLIDTQAEKGRFEESTLITSSFISETSLNNADFNRSTIKSCNFRQTLLNGTQFILSKIENSDLSEAQCQNADFARANLAGSMFIRTDFRNANFSDANLIGTLLQKSQLGGANFSGANLFRADLSQSFVNAKTRFNGALTKRAKTLPRCNGDII